MIFRLLSCLFFLMGLSAVTSCKQDVGGVCQVNDDCSSGLVCNQQSGVCQEIGGETVDAPEEDVDAPEQTVDAPVDAEIDAPVDAPPPDAATS